MKDVKTVKLPNGMSMPKLGLGTWKSPAKLTKQAVKVAVRNGYRLIDCANDYDNEHVIGEALSELFQEGTCQREDLFIQAKLWNTNHRPEHVKPDLMATMKDLGVTYVDSFVIHWPQAAPSKGLRPALRTDGIALAHYADNTMFPLDKEGFYCSDQESHYVDTWKEMERLVDQGLARSIGLSNFNRNQVMEILSIPDLKYRPSVLQNESHPYLQEKDLRDFCRIQGIVFQAYSPLGSADRPWRYQGSLTSGPPSCGYELLDNPMLKQIARKYPDKTVANIVIKWHLQMGGTLVCKSVTPERIIENFNVWDFDLDSEDMRRISDLNIGWRHLMWAETAMHPDYPFKSDLPHGFRVTKPTGQALANK